MVFVITLKQIYNKQNVEQKEIQNLHFKKDHYGV